MAARSASSSARRAPEHLPQRGAGPVSGQELPVPQVRAQRGGPRPVLHRGGHPLRRPAQGHRPADTPPPDQAVLGDLGLHRRDLRHLPPLHPGFPRAVQIPGARGAAGRLVPDHVIGMIGQLHRRARLPLRPARLPAGFCPQRLRRRLAQPVRRRRPGGVLRVLPHPGRKIGDLRLKDRCPLPQLTGLRHRIVGLDQGQHHRLAERIESAGDAAGPAAPGVSADKRFLLCSGSSGPCRHGGFDRPPARRFHGA